ncbi:MAG: hypothetical protein F6J98_14510 [Moorea sp. SIO4G2]|nr:hypothetical protein [Moorena sp. SIO4G2]
MISLYYFVPNSQKDTSDLLVKDTPGILVTNLREIKLFDTEGKLVMNRIDKLKLSKFKVFKKERIDFFYSNFEFYIETVTQELDITNRPAIIGIYGKIPVFKNGYTVQDWLFYICNRFENFSKNIDREIYDLQLNTIKKQLLGIYLQTKWKRFVFPIIQSLIFLFTPIFIAWVISSFLNTTNLIVPSCIISISNGILIILNEENW